MAQRAVLTVWRNIDTEWRSDWKWDRVLPHLLI